MRTFYQDDTREISQDERLYWKEIIIRNICNSFLIMYDMCKELGLEFQSKSEVSSARAISVSEASLLTFGRQR
jgi:hypothetical protein